ncbi:MAG TPA: molybdate ABC transporter substrate-binding protein [Polyangia bacterium]
MAPKTVNMIWAGAAVALLAGGTLALSRTEAPSGSALRIAAASDLAVAFKELGIAFEKQSGERLVFTFGSTGLLEKQIAEGAPFDLFAAANVSYADQAIAAGACATDKTEYARGRLVLWSKKGGTTPPTSIAELADARFLKIAIANPAHAPYGKAAEEALEKAGLWSALTPKLVYGENIQQTMQFAQTGNADVALVALSLAVVAPEGEWTAIDEADHLPIDQAMVVCGQHADRLARARRFASFVGSPAGRAIMTHYGFLLPGETRTASAR